MNSPARRRRSLSAPRRCCSWARDRAPELTALIGAITGSPSNSSRARVCVYFPARNCVHAEARARSYRYVYGFGRAIGRGKGARSMLLAVDCGWLLAVLLELRGLKFAGVGFCYIICKEIVKCTDTSDSGVTAIF